MFKSIASHLKQDFTPSGWDAIGKSLRQIPAASQQEIFQWHYKHTMLNSWGSTELKSKLRTFDFGEGDYGVADMYNLDGPYTPPPSSQLC